MGRRPVSDVTWFGGAYLAYIGLCLLLAASRIGESRKPVTGGEVFFGFVNNTLIIWGLFTVGVTS